MDTKFLGSALLLVGLAVSTNSALAVYNHQPDGRALDACLETVKRDDDGKRLRFFGTGWVDSNAISGRHVVYANARTVAGDAAGNRRVRCETNASGSRVLAVSVERGKYVGATA